MFLRAVALISAGLVSLPGLLFVLGLRAVRAAAAPVSAPGLAAGVGSLRGFSLCWRVPASCRLATAWSLRRLSLSLNILASASLGCRRRPPGRRVLWLPVRAVSRAPDGLCLRRGRLLGYFDLHNRFLGFKGYEVRVNVRPASDLFRLYALFGTELKSCRGDVFHIVVVFELLHYFQVLLVYTTLDRVLYTMLEI